MASRSTPHILENFELPDDLVGNFRAKCRYCNKEISGCMRSTSNFIKHIKRNHFLKYQEFKDHKVPVSETQQKLNILSASSKKYPPQDAHQLVINDALVNFIAGDLIPLSIVESPRFRSFILQLDPKYQLPTRKHLSNKIIKEKYIKMRENLTKEFEKVHNLSLTTDLWSNRQMRSYIGITGHYILNWRMNSVMVACHRFQGRHTACNIYEVFQDIVASYKISNKISSIITDNASNMVKAFSLPGYINTYQESDISESEDDNDDHSEDIFDYEDDVLDLLPPTRSSCFAHTLQLVVKDGLKNAGVFTKVVSKVSTIVSFVHKSTVAAEILEGEKRLQSSVPTRWNSQLIMIKTILEVDTDKLESLDTTKLASYELNSLKDLVEILSPFEEATNIAQIENKVSSSLVIPCIRGLRIKLQFLCTKYSNSLVTSLADSLERRLSVYEREEIYTIACTLDPRFKLKWCKNESERSYQRVVLLSKMPSIDETILHSQTIIEHLESNTESREPNRSSLFSFMESDEEHTTFHGTNKSELDDYLIKHTIPDDSDPLSFWKDNESTYPNLAELAKKYLAIPASSAPVERLFSIGGKIFRPDRCNLSDERFEMLMFLKSHLK